MGKKLNDLTRIKEILAGYGACDAFLYLPTIEEVINELYDVNGISFFLERPEALRALYPIMQNYEDYGMYVLPHDDAHLNGLSLDCVELNGKPCSKTSQLGKGQVFRVCILNGYDATIEVMDGECWHVIVDAASKVRYNVLGQGVVYEYRVGWGGEDFTVSTRGLKDGCRFLLFINQWDGNGKRVKSVIL